MKNQGVKKSLKISIIEKVVFQKKMLLESLKNV